MAGYYYLVSSLNEYTLEGDSKSLDFLSIRSEINENLSKGDKKLLDALLSYYDIQNLVNFIELRSNQFSPMGNCTKEEIEKLVKLFEALALRDSDQDLSDNDDDSDTDFLLPVFRNAARVIEDPKFAAKKKIDTTIGLSHILLTLYYENLRSSGNKFVKEWGEFDRNIKNISAAYSARERKADISKVIVGGGEVCQSILANQNDKDFLITDIPYSEEVIKLLSIDDILKKERGLDMLRWKKLEEMTTFSYFNIEYIMAYVLKITMISRWLLLDEKIGRSMFEMIIGTITHSSLIASKEEE